MDVRSINDVAPVVEHNGTVPVWWLVNPREMKDDHRRRVPRARQRVRSGGWRARRSAQPPDPRVLLRHLGPRAHDDRRRGARDRPGRSRAHPAERCAQPAAGLRPRADPLLLLRGRRRGRRPGRLHEPLGGARSRHPSTARRRTRSADRRRSRDRAARRQTPRSRPPSSRRASPTSTRSCACSPIAIDDAVLAAGAHPTPRRRQRRGRLRQHRCRGRGTRAASRCATRRACSTRRPPISRSS